VAEMDRERGRQVDCFIQNKEEIRAKKQINRDGNREQNKTVGPT